MELYLKTLFKLLIGHALVDFALQIDSMAKGKNHHRKPDYIPEGQKYIPCWPYWLIAHGLIHAGVVLVITKSYPCAVMELGFHVILDFCKSENLTNPNHDQALHFLCKALYATGLV